MSDVGRGPHDRGTVPQPLRHLRWLHRPPYRRDKVGAQRVEVDLVAHAGGERLDGSGRVVPAAIEAAVDDRLGATPGRLEQRGDGQGGARDHPVRRVAAHLAERLSEER